MSSHGASTKESTSDVSTASVTEALEHSDTRKRKVTGIGLRAIIGAVGGAVVGFGICMAIIMAIIPNGEPPQAPSPQATSAPQQSTGDAPALSPTPQPVPATAPTENEVASGQSQLSTTAATIELRGLPEDAVVRLDGRQVEGANLQVPIDRQVHVLRVDAPGHAQWRHSFIPRGDQALDVLMRRSHSTAKRSRRSGRRGTPSSDRRAIIRNPGF